MKILIADDESIIRIGLKSMLQQMGHEVIAAANGREALQMANRHQPDLAILDIKMPFTDGLQAAETLSRTRPIPIIILTAFSDEAMINKAANLPIHAYLVKPIQQHDLTAAIAVASKRFAEQAAQQEKTAQLAQTLEERKTIDRAKGLLMAKGMTEPEAYQYLKKTARQNQVTIYQVAQAVIKVTKE
jgi:response regulator NasT